MTGAENYTAFKTIVIREFLRFIPIWLQTVLPPALTTAVYFIIFETLIGSLTGNMEASRHRESHYPCLIKMS